MKKFSMKALVAVLLMMVVLFSACAPTVQQPTEGKTTTEGNDDKEPGSVAKPEEKPTLKWLISSSFYDLDADAGYETMQEVSGYDIEFEALSGTEQLMLIVSSGEPYDYIFLSKSNYNMMMSNAALVDITDLLDEHGKNITEAITTLWPATTVDGRIYGIPSTVAQPNSLAKSIVARGDLMEKAGIETPTTISGFYDALVALKKAYPDMIPLTTDAASGYYSANLGGAFGITGGWQEVDSKIIPEIKHPNMKEYLGYMAKLYSEGLLDAEMPALKKNDMAAKWTSGKAVMMVTTWNGIETSIGAMRELVPDMKTGVMPIMAGEDGTRIAEMKTGFNAVAGIPISSEHPVDTIKAINEVIEMENFTKVALGEKGVHYDLDANGNYSLIQPAFNNERVNSNVFISGFYREDIYPKMWEARLAKNADLEWVFKTFRASIDGIGVANPTSLAPPVTVIDNLSALNTYISDSLNGIVAGVQPVDYLDTVIEYWDANGGTKVEEFYNNWYYNQ